MAINGIFYDNQIVNSKGLGALFEGVLSDGIIKGCNVVHNGSVATVKAGYFIIAGRLTRITADQSFPAVSGTGVARITVTVDLSETASATAFEQCSLKLDTASTIAGLPPLTKGDINGTGTKYQMSLGILNYSASTITGIAEKTPVAHTPKLIIPAEQIVTSVPSSLTSYPDGYVFAVKQG